MTVTEMLQRMLRSFFVITVGIVASTGIFCVVLQPDATFDISIFGKILLMAAVSVLPHFIFFSKKEISKRQMALRTCIHAIVLLSVLLFFASLWDWITLTNPIHLGMFCLLVLGVYLMTILFTFQNDKKLADRLNEGLREYNRNQTPKE